jgi:hypothetical protein
MYYTLKQTITLKTKLYTVYTERTGSQRKESLATSVLVEGGEASFNE